MKRRALSRARVHCFWLPVMLCANYKSVIEALVVAPLQRTRRCGSRPKPVPLVSTTQMVRSSTIRRVCRTTGRTSRCQNQARSTASVVAPMMLEANEADGHCDNGYQKRYQDLMDASTLSLAPMMEYTDRHFRQLVRLISSRTLLYTEMVAANAIAHERRDSILEANRSRLEQQELHRTEKGNSHVDSTCDMVNDDQSLLPYSDHFLKRYLGQSRSFSDYQHDNHHPLDRPIMCHEGPCVLQLGGSDPQQLYEAAQTVMDMTERGHCDYTALNLNCGCPSPKVAGKGCFGAALMDEADRVAALTRAMWDGTGGRLPVSVKCRIGTDSEHAFSRLHPPQAYQIEHQYQTLCRFIDTVASAGVATDFSVHARIAVLQKSFSPADNRNIPPLQYDLVRRLVLDFPHLTFTLNGGVNSIAQAQAQLEAAPGLKGVMVGRAWAADPWSFAMADQLLYGTSPISSTSNALPQNRLQILEAYGRHADWEEAHNGEPDKIRRFITKAVSPLFAGEPNAKRYRIALDEVASLPKKLKSEGKSMTAGQPPLSELILNAALKHLDMETLLRTPEESYQRILQAEQKRRQASGSRSSLSVGSSASIDEWQALRKEEAQNAEAYEDLVAG